MKRAFFLMWFVAVFVTALAERKDETKNPVIGSWKFSNQSFVNDFQPVLNYKRNYPSEYFTFEANHDFKHDFYDQKNNLAKTLTGKWKISDGKIKIQYADINFTLTVDYFFIGKDLVLGLNFNHVIFTKENLDYNVAMK